MRRPFLVFLVVITLFFWFKDVLEFLLYLFKVGGSGTGIITAIISALALVFLGYTVKKHFSKQEPYRLNEFFKGTDKKEWLLLLSVSLPVLFLSSYRSIYPDQNFDTLHFELYLQEFDFQKNKNDFAAGSIRSHYFPLVNKVYGFFRGLLGYRLGTMINTFVLIAVIASVYDFIKKVFFIYGRNFPSAITMGLVSLYIVFSENTLFGLGTYKPDLIGVPFMLELVHRIFFYRDSKASTLNHLIFFLIASLVIAYKLTYLPFVGILCLVYFLKHVKTFTPAQLVAFPLTVLLFPSIYLLYNALETGNPLFPFFNKLFQSDLYPHENFKDQRWGYRTFYEIFIYPIVTLLDKSRTNEWALYSYKLLFGYLVGLIGLVYCFVNIRKVKQDTLLQTIVFVSVLAIAFDYSVIITTGYYRYGSVVEVLYGLTLVFWFLYFQKRLVAIFLFYLIFFQAFSTFKSIYVTNFNPSWHDYKELVSNKKLLKANASLILNDYGRVQDPAGVLPGVDAFVTLGSTPLEGLSRMLKKDVPIYNIDPSARSAEVTTAFEKNVLRTQTASKRIMVAVNMEALNNGIIKSLNGKGYMITGMHEVYPSFMRFGEPVLLFRISYVDTSRYVIQSVEQYIRDENPLETRNDFAYESTGQMKAFIREAPFAFTWDFLPQEFGISVNDKTYTTKDRFKNNKIITVEGNNLRIHKPNSVPYLVIIQELKEKGG